MPKIEDQTTIIRSKFGLDEPPTPLPEKPLSPFEAYEKEQEENFKEFSKARIFLQRLVNDWNEEITATVERRLTRNIDVDVEALREGGQLDEDETLIPDRVIDTNIQREQPPYINYLKNSRRLAIFNCLSDPDIKAERLELEFTRGMTYPSWETPHFKCLDGAQTHGWDAVEVVFDENLPLHVGLEQIGHDKLFFPITNPDIQAAARVVRAYDVTSVQLKKFVLRNKFDAEQIAIILNAKEDTKNKSETTRIYKEYSKYKGQVHVSWFSLEHGVSKWLKAPMPLYLGIKNPDGSEAIVKDYPIYLLFYRETEQPKITDHKGRVFLDEYKQEAMTALLSSFINGTYRATQIYASVSQDDGTGSSLKEPSDIKVNGNRVLNKPVNFFHSDYPDPSVLKTLTFMDNSNAQETGQVNFAATNRQDSRKTAKEITSSEQQQALLNSVQLTLFSTYIRGIYNLVWLIVQSQAAQNKIRFLQVKVQQTVMNPITQTPLMNAQGQPQTQEIWVNDYNTINQIYDVRAAGDVDVIQRAEKLQQMERDWPIVSQTVLKDEFLSEMIRLKYPDTGDRWAKLLASQGTMLSQSQGLVQGFSGIITAILKENPQIQQTMTPQDMQTIQQLLASAQQLTAQRESQPNA